VTQRVDLLHDVEYRMALPSCWTRLPMDPVGMRSAARAFLLRRSAHVSRDKTVVVRRRLEDEFVALTQRPGAEYARMLLALALDVRGHPLSASCLVSVLDHDLSDEQRRQEFAGTEADGAVEAAVVEIGAHRSVVVVRNEIVRAPLPENPDAVAAQARRIATELGYLDDPDDPEAIRESLKFEADARALDVWVPVPGQRCCVLFQFSTSNVSLADELTYLFLLTASTVQFRQEDRTWA
jgi:hypothetical protein